VAADSLAAPAYRDMAMMHVAMFQCVNAIEPLYQPYKTKLQASPTTSKEAAASVAAATVLSKLHPSDAAKLDAMLKEYLAQIPDGQAKSDEIGRASCRERVEEHGVDGTVKKEIEEIER